MLGPWAVRANGPTFILQSDYAPNVARARKWVTSGKGSRRHMIRAEPVISLHLAGPELATAGVDSEFGPSPQSSALKTA